MNACNAPDLVPAYMLNDIYAHAYAALPCHSATLLEGTYAHTDAWQPSGQDCDACFGSKWFKCTQTLCFLHCKIHEPSRVTDGVSLYETRGAIVDIIATLQPVVALTVGTFSQAASHGRSAALSLDCSDVSVKLGASGRAGHRVCCRQTSWFRCLPSMAAVLICAPGTFVVRGI